MCPKCGGEMRSMVKSLSARVGPFSVKSLLPAELQEYNSVEVRVCAACGYMELYWLRDL
jgi:predicted nucleic-acid-binding Zn-ribbon protein